jgi:hypothetical protein
MIVKVTAVPLKKAHQRRKSEANEVDKFYKTLKLGTIKLAKTKLTELGQINALEVMDEEELPYDESMIEQAFSKQAKVPRGSIVEASKAWESFFKPPTLQEVDHSAIGSTTQQQKNESLTLLSTIPPIDEASPKGGRSKSISERPKVKKTKASKNLDAGLRDRSKSFNGNTALSASHEELINAAASMKVHSEYAPNNVVVPNTDVCERSPQENETQVNNNNDEEEEIVEIAEEQQEEIDLIGNQLATELVQSIEDGNEEAVLDKVDEVVNAYVEKLKRMDTQLSGGTSGAGRRKRFQITKSGSFYRVLESIEQVEKKYGTVKF